MACLFLDSRRVYNMSNTYDVTTKLSTQPVTTLRSIALAEERGLEFDFEGSMIPGVAEYDSTFNPIKEPYFIISNFSDKYRLLNGLRESAQALKGMVKRRAKAAPCPFSSRMPKSKCRLGTRAPFCPAPR